MRTVELTNQQVMNLIPALQELTGKSFTDPKLAWRIARAAQAIEPEARAVQQVARDLQGQHTAEGEDGEPSIDLAALQEAQQGLMEETVEVRVPTLRMSEMLDAKVRVKGESVPVDTKPGTLMSLEPLVVMDIDDESEDTDGE